MSESGSASTDSSARSGEQLEIIPTDILESLSFAAIFENERPIEIDLGSGSGRFLIEAARQYPERNFFGVERLLGRVRKTLRAASRLGLTNVRVLRLEIDYTVRFLLSPGSVSRLHLSFPDPWPKRRHSRRRLVDEGFLAASASALAIGGELWIKTDHADYFQRITKAVDSRKDLFVCVPWCEEYPRTDFEEAYRSQNLSIYQLRLRKVN
ncbi:MAG: tRNA (guanosine(46)-N7)-methyltransferase TrmB [Chthoniobacterales bacterium]